MAETTEFELVSPERLLLSRPVTMVIMPGSEGYFGAQPGHAPFIATLKPGVIDVYEGGKVVERIFVAGGFADVTPEKLVILAETATPIAELNRATITERIQSLENVAEFALGADNGQESHIIAELNLNRAMLVAIDSTPL